MEKKILVPLGPEIRDLKSVHYALAAAERLQAAIIILRLADGHIERTPWIEETLTDLVANARDPRSCYSGSAVACSRPRTSSACSSSERLCPSTCRYSSSSARCTLSMA